jgi:hypothetical protein
MHSSILIGQISSADLMAEVRARLADRQKKQCDYCHRDRNTNPCKFPRRHDGTEVIFGSSDYIDFVVDGPPGPEAPKFVETEGPGGASIKCGDWIRKDDGWWALRIYREAFGFPFEPIERTARLLLDEVALILVNTPMEHVVPNTWKKALLDIIDVVQNRPGPEGDFQGDSRDSGPIDAEFVEESDEVESNLPERRRAAFNSASVVVRSLVEQFPVPETVVMQTQAFTSTKQTQAEHILDLNIRLADWLLDG